MEIDFSNTYQKTIENVYESVRDVTRAIQGDPSTTSKYRIIPIAKKGKNNLIFNAVDFKTLNETVVFMSQKTIGVKLYSKNHTYLCDYSVSRNNGIQILALNYPDKTGMRQESFLDPESGKYILKKVTLTVPARDIVNVDDFSDEIIDENLLVDIIYTQNPNTGLIGLSAGFVRDTKSENRFYNIDEHPELAEITSFIGKNSGPFIQTHLNCMAMSDSNPLYHEVGEFYSAFKNMIKQMEKNQNESNTENDKDGNIDEKDTQTTPESDTENR